MRSLGLVSGGITQVMAGSQGTGVALGEAARSGQPRPAPRYDPIGSRRALTPPGTRKARHHYIYRGTEGKKKARDVLTVTGRVERIAGRCRSSRTTSTSTDGSKSGRPATTRRGRRRQRLVLRRGHRGV